jgi:hypothetical protein
MDKYMKWALLLLCRTSEQQDEAEKAISQLQLCTVEYCWQQLSQDEWSMILHRTHESIAAMAVLLEEQVCFYCLVCNWHVCCCVRHLLPFAMSYNVFGSVLLN